MLRFTDLFQAGITYEFGFTDHSHLDKTFLVYNGVTAIAFRMKFKKA
ncbi:hypothetical protein [Persicobacter diffluens]|uniref:HTH araC/xylS-type domain-containing protein n=1 Tax=Persicobacter diffluens TaxID=981 RepID=A0AAN5APP1_9BACT|nr:hypothetical protein PEDI_46000 [Persicobacter diffluens]